MNQPDDEIKARVEEIIGYQFTDANIINKALIHASVADDSLDSNERLEFLGDAVLDFVICEYLYHEFPYLREGELTKIKSSVVSRDTCAEISDSLGLTDMLILGKGMNGQTGLPSSVAAAVYESIIAAVYIDGGIDIVRQFILSHMKSIIADAKASAHQYNFKSVLQQYAQSEIASLPAYILLDEKGPDHSKCFEICVEIEGKRYSSAWGQSKKKAEQQAALFALEELNIVKTDKNNNVQLLQQIDPDDTSK